MAKSQQDTIDLTMKTCEKCTSATRAVSGERLEELMAQVKDWKLLDDSRKIAKTYKFADFAGALEFTYYVGNLAEREGHHPDIHLSWGKVVVELSTHKVNGLSENDFILAAKIDAMLEGFDLE